MTKKPPKRPSFIRHFSELELSEPAAHPLTGERLVLPAPLSDALGLRRLVVRHDTLLPGHRSSNPHAERDEEELVLVLEGTPDLWLDGYVYRMKPGQAAGWPGLDGLAHCLINDTDDPVRLLTVGEASRYVSQIHFPLDRDGTLAAWLDQHGKRWRDPPRRKLGPHDGLPERVRGRRAPKASRLAKKPASVVDWKHVQRPDDSHYPNDDELLGIGSPLAQALGLTRLGVWIDFLPPGRRTSWPHAEFDEEEMVFVLDGEPDAWIDGWLHRLGPGDAAGFPDHTGIAHCVINDSEAPVRLVIVGEASRQRSKCFYPLHPKRNREIGVGAWKNPPRKKLGPHDGLPAKRRTKRRR